VKIKFFPMLFLCGFSLASAETIKTTDGKTYRNVTVSSVEPDGVILSAPEGKIKVPFSVLPSEIQSKYGYDVNKSAKFQKASGQAKLDALSDASQNAARQKEEAMKSALQVPRAIPVAQKDAAKEDLEKKKQREAAFQKMAQQERKTAMDTGNQPAGHNPSAATTAPKPAQPVVKKAVLVAAPKPAAAAKEETKKSAPKQASAAAAAPKTQPKKEAVVVAESKSEQVVKEELKKSAPEQTPAVVVAKKPQPKKAVAAAPPDPRWKLKGEVKQRVWDGILVTCTDEIKPGQNTASGTILLKNYPSEEATYPGDKINVPAYPLGVVDTVKTFDGSEVAASFDAYSFTVSDPKKKKKR